MSAPLLVLGLFLHASPASPELPQGLRFQMPYAEALQLLPDSTWEQVDVGTVTLTSRSVAAFGAAAQLRLVLRQQKLSEVLLQWPVGSAHSEVSENLAERLGALSHLGPFIREGAGTRDLVASIIEDNEALARKTRNSVELELESRAYPKHVFLKVVRWNSGRWSVRLTLYDPARQPGRSLTGGARQPRELKSELQLQIEAADLAKARTAAQSPTPRRLTRYGHRLPRLTLDGVTAKQLESARREMAVGTVVRVQRPDPRHTVAVIREENRSRVVRASHPPGFPLPLREGDEVQVTVGVRDSTIVRDRTPVFACLTADWGLDSGGLDFGSGRFLKNANPTMELLTSFPTDGEGTWELEPGLWYEVESPKAKWQVWHFHEGIRRDAPPLRPGEGRSARQETCWVRLPR